MFSSLNNGVTASAGTPASSTRGRRRQRPPGNDESVRQQPKAKRARIPLNEQTFANAETNQETYEVKPARPPAAVRRQDSIEDVENSSPQTKKELSFRSKKAKTADRLNKGDGSVVLVRPSSPPELPIVNRGPVVH